MIGEEGAYQVALKKKKSTYYPIFAINGNCKKRRGRNGKWKEAKKETRGRKKEGNKNFPFHQLLWSTLNWNRNACL